MNDIPEDPYPSAFSYLTSDEFERLKAFSKDKQTPFLYINLSTIEKEYDELVGLFPFASIYYAIKANPEKQVIDLLSKKGSCFDVASIYEINQLLDQGVNIDKMSYGNTIKKSEDIAYAYSKGIRIYASDSYMDLEKIAKNAPGSKVYIRLLSEGVGADWPLSKKFGTTKDIAVDLLVKAKSLGLIPYGVSFHVGSQQRNIQSWDEALTKCKYVFDKAKESGIELKLINMGGGLPSSYIKATEEMKVYAESIKEFLTKNFGENIPEIIIEPGRSMVADSGVLVTEVILVSHKENEDKFDWVYLDTGKFGGLIETIDESIKYPIFTEDGKNKIGTVAQKEVILAGPTCDSADVLYEKYKYKLPEDLKEGDRLYILTTGAYTNTYSSVYFNGFPPLKVYIAD